jgi:hypothetical protein
MWIRRRRTYDTCARQRKYVEPRYTHNGLVDLRGYWWALTMYLLISKINEGTAIKYVYFPQILAKQVNIILNVFFPSQWLNSSSEIVCYQKSLDSGDLSLHYKVIHKCIFKCLSTCRSWRQVTKKKVMTGTLLRHLQILNIHTLCSCCLPSTVNQ